jgi:hypothetical protein
MFVYLKVVTERTTAGYYRLLAMRYWIITQVATTKAIRRLPSSIESVTNTLTPNSRLDILRYAAFTLNATHTEARWTEQQQFGPPAPNKSFIEWRTYRNGQPPVNECRASPNWHTKHVHSQQWTIIRTR